MTQLEKKTVQNVLEQMTYARKIPSLVNGHEITGREDTEVRASLSVLRLLKIVVPEVDVGRDQRASDLLPVRASIGSVGNSLTIVVTNRRPASLGHPDGLALGNVVGLVQAVEEQGGGILDRVAVGRLPVWVAVEADPVNVGDDLGVGGVLKRVVGVDVADGDARESSAGDGGADLGDVVDQGVDIHTRVGGIALGVTVQILAADRDTLDKVGEVGAVLADRSLQSGDLIGNG